VKKPLLKRCHFLKAQTKYRPDAILVPTIQHSGTHYIMRCLNYNYAKLDRDGMIKVNKVPCSMLTHTYDLINGHFDTRADTLVEMSRHMKTVIPLRHPALIAVSHKKREGWPRHEIHWHDQWLKMCEVENAFHFTLEDKPFVELEKFTGMKVHRFDKVVRSLGDYPEKKNLKTIRDFLKEEWDFVEKALNTKIGRRFYDNTYLRGLRCP
jgi:hypothetical protein